MADPLIPTQLDFTDRDFDSLVDRLTNLASSVFPDWTDFNRANFGNILLRLIAFVGDVDNFYLDALARESRITSVTQRKNMIALGKLIGFELFGAVAATVDIDITLTNGPLAGDVSIPAGTIISTRSAVAPISFQVLSPIVIPAGQTLKTGTVENSDNASDIFTSNNRPDQVFVLGARPFLDGSLGIVAGNGSYTEVDDFLNSTDTDLHFTVEVNQNDQATVRFGDGVNGAIPTGSITFTYKVGGGVVGNVDANEITEIEGSFVDSLTNPAELTATNLLGASGGVDRQTVAQARILAPLSLRVLTRTVTRDDFEIGALGVPGVARALMLTSNEDVSVGENTGDLYVIATGGGVPSTTLKAQVLTAVTITKPSTLTFVTSVVDPIFKTITVDATVFLQSGADAATIKTAIETALADFFAVSKADGTPNLNVDFGFNIKKADGTPAAELAWSDVFNVVRDVTGVRKVDDATFDLDGSPDDVPLVNNEFPKLGTITLTNGDTTAPL